MRITLAPQRSDDRLDLHRAGDVLTINGTAHDFGALAEGAVLPRAAVGCDSLVSDVTRQGGVICLTLILPHGAVAPEATLFPAPLEIAADGPVALPPYEAAPEAGPDP
ncbi:hypothetical protein [Ruixingdingia sedimenti]|uniref:Uncharacterized protein n=1 Tax=Ruixingdingia sedimenti TaxID=3073604 RepID=A0ABU1F4K1_9RHOB|nr:hypothetical protein [Xinfangfangia sp. LG-4]MDR5651796.1 hypothetical protein [Xinfangfangia sp. LG-4]